ncbi:MAG TPA: tetratricopeptide repeat protein [Desulfocapsa sulfexigens]|nr:tetratricopeptide repeat protein [Desulfocapsa sulfexigens]
MDAVTYPNETVIDFINQNLIPLRVASDQQPIASDFNVTWTPALFILDKEGREHHHTVGFLDGSELIPSLLLGIGNLHFNGDDFEKALSSYKKIVADYSESDAAPEAIFQQGVSLYKSTNDPLSLRKAYEHLLDKYPENKWTKRAYPYRLIS